MFNKKSIFIFYVIFLILICCICVLKSSNAYSKNPGIKDDGSNGGNVPLIYYNL